MKFGQILKKILVKIVILQETLFFHDKVSNCKNTPRKRKKKQQQQQQGHMRKLVINNIDMKYYEILTKTA